MCYIGLFFTPLSKEFCRLVSPISTLNQEFELRRKEARQTCQATSLEGIGIGIGIRISVAFIAYLILQLLFLPQSFYECHE